MNYSDLETYLQEGPQSFLITGCAGFIGSHILAKLLQLGQKVRGIDNFLTGHRHNLDTVKTEVGEELWQNFEFIEADLRDAQVCQDAVQNIDYVIHQAALGSVPRSIEKPMATHEHNVNAFLNLLIAAKDAEVKNFVYASSSSVYGDSKVMPKKEGSEGQALSPYAASKKTNELYAQTFAQAYGFRSVGLRYFNIFGQRQDPNGPYAAVIPRWAEMLKAQEAVQINGDGSTSRDFTHVSNAVQANLLACLADLDGSQVFNIACGHRYTLLELLEALANALKMTNYQVKFGEFRAGDIAHSWADISKAKEKLQYSPQITLPEGLALL